MKLDIINGVHLKQIFSSGSKQLDINQNKVDLLNVFPVPDGDTGTNMSLTARAAVQKALDLSSDSLTEVAAAASNGSLMGARGNSGVILSQIFRGWATAFASKQEANPKELAMAFQLGADTAYKAVMRPVEGTILTVAREGALGAVSAAKGGADILGVLQAALKQSYLALQKTPEQLPVLKEAGVVDAGGQGLVFFLEGAIAGLSGEESSLVTSPSAEGVFPKEIGFTPSDGLEIEFQYCTEFILKGLNLSLDKIKSGLLEQGDCLLVVGSEETVKIHIHTNHPGRILEYCLGLGSLHHIQINNMKEQNSSLEGKLQAAEAELENSAGKEIGLLAVAAGSGFAEIFLNLGAQIVIQGGQTMNPSTEEFVKGIEMVNARQVIILPNNKNIIMTAEQVQEFTQKEIIVVPTQSIPQGIAALLTFNQEIEGADNASNMFNAFQKVITGEITRAVRDAVFESKEIKAGDLLGLLDGKITCLGQDKGELLTQLINLAKEPQHELATIYYGLDIAAEDAENYLASLQKAFPELEIELHYGGQPLYDFMFSIE